MKTSYLFISAVLGIVLLGSSCSTRCESVCFRYNDCSVKQRATDIDCPVWCADAAAITARAQAEQTDCSSQWSEYVACWEQNQAKVCDATYTDCTTKGTAYVTCVNAYCVKVKADGKTDPLCNTTANPARTLFTPF
jgi:hypothetical protein